MKAIVYTKYGPPDGLQLKAGVCELLGAELCNVPTDTIFVHPKQLAAYVGIAPAPYQPGAFAGDARISKLGNPRLRRVL